MVLEGLGQSLRNAIKRIANASHVDQKLVKEVVKDIQRALLQADVNVKLVLQMTKEIEERFGEKISRWSGDKSELTDVDAVMKKFLAGKYRH